MFVLSTGCSGETVERPPPPPVNWQSLQQVRPNVVDAGPIKATGKERGAADAYTRGIASPGCTLLGPALHEDAHFAFAGYKDAHGRANVIKAHEALFGAFDQRNVTTNRVWLTDSTQAVEWVMTGVQARDWEGIAPTRKPISIRGLTLLWTKDDGSISDVHVYFDEAVVKAELGSAPKGFPSPLPLEAPAAKRQEFEQTHGPEETSNVAQVRASLEALERNDEAAYLATMIDDVEVNTLERAQSARGKAEARAYFKAMHKAIGQLDTSVDNVWGIAQFVVVEYVIIGEQTGPIGWVPAQHDAVLKMSIVDVVELQDGKIARVWRYDNPGQVLTP